MTPGDIDVFRAIVREEITAAEQRTVPRQDALEQRMLQRQNAAVEALTTNMCELREELSRRMETLEKRFDNLAPVIISLDTRVAAFTRSVDNVLKDHDQTAATLEGIRRAMADLYARVARLEGQKPPTH